MRTPFLGAWEDILLNDTRRDSASDEGAYTLNLAVHANAPFPGRRK